MVKPILSDCWPQTEMVYVLKWIWVSTSAHVETPRMCFTTQSFVKLVLTLMFEFICRFLLLQEEKTGQFAQAGEVIPSPPVF